MTEDDEVIARQVHTVLHAGGKPDETAIRLHLNLQPIMRVCEFMCGHRR